jgi:hypothetical protein
MCQSTVLLSIDQDFLNKFSSSIETLDSSIVLFVPSSGEARASYKLCSFSINKKVEVVFHLLKNWGRLLFTLKLRLSLIFKEINVIFHFKEIEAIFQLMLAYLGIAWLKDINSAFKLDLKLGLSLAIYILLSFLKTRIKLLHLR